MSGKAPDDPPKSRSVYKALVPAVEQASRILICLAGSVTPKMTLTQICNRVGIHKSKGYSILNTLGQFGFVEKDPRTKEYSLGVGLLFLGRSVLDNLDMKEIVSPYLEMLSSQTSSTALFGLISAEQVFITAKHETNQAVGVTIRLGHRFHISAGAHGKAIVAFMPEEERRMILGRDRLYFYGDTRSMDKRLLEKELAECRKSGFAIDKGGLQPGINAVSAPVFGSGDRMIGCLIVIGTFSDNKMQEYGPKVVRAAMKISSQLGAETDWF